MIVGTKIILFVKQISNKLNNIDINELSKYSINQKKYNERKY